MLLGDCLVVAEGPLVQDADGRQVSNSLADAGSLADDLCRGDEPHEASRAAVEAGEGSGGRSAGAS
jgi:hypothetical protein